MSATPSIHEVDAHTLKSWLDEGKATVYDVREPDEHVREHIPGSTLIPLSRFDPGEVARSNGAKTVLYCRSGRRSTEAAQRLIGAGHTDVVQLKGGFEAWKHAGLPAAGDAKAPISIMRQVQITIGVGVLIASILAATISPWFLVLTGFFGAGLLFAGVSGTCGLASLLSRMPWNKAFACTPAQDCRPTT